MIRAEKFVKRLTQENIIAQEFADGLLERIAQSKQAVPADAFAQRLVERGVITQAISDHVLELLEKADAAKKAKLEKKKLPSPPSPFQGMEAELGFLSDDLQSNPFGPQSANEPEVPSVFRPKQGKFKKAKSNPWDSKLLLYGICGIFLLLVMGISLFYAIYRRGAEEYLNAANAARDSGNYSVAIKEYEDFIKFFPTHARINEANIRLSLSKMRLITDSKSNWSQALNVAKEEIAKVVVVPDYRSDAEPEFTAMLPTIAENLANGAKDKKDAKLLAEAEESMLLVQKHVPVSSQPVDRLQKIQVNIDFTKREIAKDARLLAVAGEVGSRLRGNDGGNGVLAAYEKAVALQIEYPGIEKDERFLEILQDIAHNEKNAAKLVDSGQWAVDSGNQKHPTPHSPLPTSSSIILADRKAGSEPATKAPRTLFAYAAGSIFALQSTDGKILWKKVIGGSNWTIDNSPTVFPASIVPASVGDTDNDQEEAFLIDYRTWDVLRLDAKTGEIRFRCRIGEPFRMMDIPTNRRLASFFLTTHTGKCVQVDANSGQVLGVLRFPQTTNVAPLVDFDNDCLIQVAHRTSLYICPLQQKTGETLTFNESAPAQSVYLGHLPGTIRATPFFFGPYLLIPRQNHPVDSELCVYEMKKEEEYSLSLVQTIALQGKIDTTPLKDGKRLFLATDTGRVTLYALDENPSASQPIRFIAERPQDTAPGITSTASTVRMWDSPRYLGLFDGNLWVAGNEVTAFEVQQSRSSLVPKHQMDPLTTTLAPLRRIDNTIFRTYRYQGQNTVAIKALALPDGKTLWETLFAVPCVGEPTWDADSKTLRCVTETGKLYKIPDSQTNTGFVVVDKPFADLVGEKRGEPIRFLVPLANSMEAWVESVGSSKAIPVFDPSPTNPQQFRFIPMSEKIQAEPVAFGTGLLVPLNSGKVALFDPQTGAMLADPFFVKLSPGNVTLWSSPWSVIGGSGAGRTLPTFLVLDQQQYTLYRVVAERNTQGGRKIKLRITAQSPISELDRRGGSNQIVQLGETALIFSLKRGTAQEVQLDFSAELKMETGRIRDFGAEIVWGPFLQGDHLFFATSEPRLHILSVQDGAITEQKKEIPPDFSLVGRPFVQGNRFYFSSSTGTLWTLGDDVEEALRPTGLPAACGPIFVENRICSPGKDGGLYFYE